IQAKATQKEKLVLDTVLTPELIEEGDLREFLRSIQELRQKAHLNPGDTIDLYVTGPDAGIAFLRKHEKQIKSDIRAKSIQQKRVAHAQAEDQLTVGKWKVWAGVKKA